MSEEDKKNLETMLIDFEEYSTDYTKTRCKELNETIENTLEYIHKLQQENKQLKQDLKDGCYVIEKLKEDKKKAREFIEEWCTINPTTGKCVCYLDKNRCTELYKILGDKENE